MRLYLPLALFSVLFPLTACSGSPETLATDVQTAFEKGDMDAALALGQFEPAPAMLRFFYLDEVRDCGAVDNVCTARAAPLDDKFKEKLAGLGSQGLESAATPEGLIIVESKSTDGKSSGKMQMPYAQVDGKYRLITQRYTAAKLAEMKALTNQQLLDKMLADGIYDPASGERRTDWKDTATALPADGGEPGQTLVRTTTSLHAAVTANDPDAAVKSGDGFAAMSLAENGYDGKPVALAERKAKLRAQGLRFLHDVKVQGGWLRGDDAILMIDAKDGVNWIARGAVFMSKNPDGSGWDIAGKEIVSYPQ